MGGGEVILDYAHNAAGLETLGDFVDRLASDSAISERPGEASRAANLVVGVVATAGDRRDDDMRELGRVAARHFDVVIVREDRHPRGRKPGEAAGPAGAGVSGGRAAALGGEGVREAIDSGKARAGTVEIVLDEMEAARKALDRARP